jgi:hypothetical protein
MLLCMAEPSLCNKAINIQNVPLDLCLFIARRRVSCRFCLRIVLVCNLSAYSVKKQGMMFHSVLRFPFYWFFMSYLHSVHTRTHNGEDSPFLYVFDLRKYSKDFDKILTYHNL